MSDILDGVLVHPAAAVWPMLPPDELAALGESIRAVGLLEPIERDDEGQIVDGRNRYAACVLVDIEPEFVVVKPPDVAAYILAKNDARRHMTKGQRALATWLTMAAGNEAANYSQIARQIEVDHTLVGWAKTVAEDAPALVPLVLDGGMSLKAAYDKAVKDRRDAEERDAEMQALHANAPDLATLVTEERLALADAVAVYHERTREERERELARRADGEQIVATVARALGVLDSLTDDAARARTRGAFAEFAAAATPHDRALINPTALRTIATALTTYADEVNTHV